MLYKKSALVYRFQKVFVWADQDEGRSSNTQRLTIHAVRRRRWPVLQSATGPDHSVEVIQQAVKWLIAQEDATHLPWQQLATATATLTARAHVNMTFLYIIVSNEKTTQIPIPTPQTGLYCPGGRACAVGLSKNAGFLDYCGCPGPLRPANKQKGGVARSYVTPGNSNRRDPLPKQWFLLGFYKKC